MLRTANGYSAEPRGRGIFIAVVDLNDTFDAFGALGALVDAFGALDCAFGALDALFVVPLKSNSTQVRISLNNFLLNHRNSGQFLLCYDMYTNSNFLNN